MVVQKFGGSYLSTAELRREAMQRVWDEVDRGFTPVVVVSAMGRFGDPYATDTQLEQVKEANPKAQGANEDLLLSCGENIAATHIAAGMCSQGLHAVA